MKTETHGRWIRANVYVNGQLRRKKFPVGTPASVIMAWREQERKATEPAAPNAAGSFAADVAAYLPRIAAKKTAAQIAAHLACWVRELGGDRPRASITPADIDQVLQRWAVLSLAPGTLRKRRGTLVTMFVVLDGKGATNPIKASAAPKPSKVAVRGLRYDVIARLLAAMPRQVDVKEGAVPRPALGHLRASVLAYTGLPPGLLQQLRPKDIDWTAAELRLPARDKGAGVEAHTIPLTAHGLAALQAFHQAGAYGAFAIGALNVAVKRAGVRVDVPLGSFHLYDLRHSFGAEMYRTTRDLATVARFLGHAEGSPMTARYAKAAHEEVDRAAASLFLAAAPPAAPAPAAAPKRARAKAKRAFSQRGKIRIAKVLRIS